MWELKQWMFGGVGVGGNWDRDVGVGGWGWGCFYGELCYYLCVRNSFFSKKKFFLLREMCGYSVFYFAVLV